MKRDLYIEKEARFEMKRDVFIDISHSQFDTGWRRPIGCLISWITFRKLATNYRALLRKMTYKDKASYDSTPPCTTVTCDLI